MASFLLLYVLVLCATLINPISCYIKQTKPKVHSKSTLFVFGDSLFDSGNNQYFNTNSSSTSKKGIETSWPYGETFFKHPTGRRSDGRLVPDFIALFAKLPMLPPYLQPGAHNFTDGSNFASGGAGVLPQKNNHESIYLGLQVSYFKTVVKSLRKKLGDAETKKLLMRAVYLFSIGGNDYSSTYFQNPNATQSYWQNFEKIVIGNITNVLKDIHSMGGRKFAFQNVAPLGCLPGTKARSNGRCDEKLLQIAQHHNKALSNALKKLQSRSFGKIKYSIFDYYNSLQERIDHPTEYGFKVGDAACCGTGAYRSANCGMGSYELCSKPSEYVWFDGGHTTESANWQFAKLLWSGSRNVTWPYNLKELFGHS